MERFAIKNILLHQLPNAQELFEVVAEEFRKKSAIYFGQQPTFDEIMLKINENIDLL